MSSAFDVDREEWYEDGWYNGVYFSAKYVKSSSGALRPVLDLPLSVMTLHFTGAGASWLDSGDSFEELNSIERFARSAKKPNEYNSGSDIDSVTFEYAGPFRAAHSKGFNGSSWGHITLLGLENPNDKQLSNLIVGIRKARRQNVERGNLTANHVIVPHSEQRPTNCPGVLFNDKDVWREISAPLKVPPPVGEEEEMKLKAAINEDGDKKWVHVGDGIERWGMPLANYQALQKAGGTDNYEWLGYLPREAVEALGQAR